MEFKDLKVKIGGIQKLTLLDFPGEPACIIFFQGCNLRCPWCYNPELVLPDKFTSTINPEQIKAFLEKRKGKLQVVLCGGEPLVQPDIIPMIKLIKDMGFKIKLDTNGTLPEKLFEIISEKLVDYIAVDLKLLPKDYKSISGTETSELNILKTIEILQKSTIPYEFRTTLIPGIHNKENIQEIVSFIKHIPNYYLQAFKPIKNLREDYKNLKPFTTKELLEILDKIREIIPRAKLRSHNY